MYSSMYCSVEILYCAVLYEAEHFEVNREGKCTYYATESVMIGSVLTVLRKCDC